MARAYFSHDDLQRQYGDLQTAIVMMRVSSRRPHTKAEGHTAPRTDSNRYWVITAACKVEIKCMKPMFQTESSVSFHLFFTSSRAQPSHLFTTMIRGERPLIENKVCRGEILIGNFARISIN